jgi:hypothetical protein
MLLRVCMWMGKAKRLMLVCVWMIVRFFTHS